MLAAACCCGNGFASGIRTAFAESWVKLGESLDNAAPNNNEYKQMGEYRCSALGKEMLVCRYSCWRPVVNNNEELLEATVKARDEATMRWREVRSVWYVNMCKNMKNGEPDMVNEVVYTINYVCNKYETMKTWKLDVEGIVNRESVEEYKRKIGVLTDCCHECLEEHRELASECGWYYCGTQEKKMLKRAQEGWLRMCYSSIKTAEMLFSRVFSVKNAG